MGTLPANLIELLFTARGATITWYLQIDAQPGITLFLVESTGFARLPPLILEHLTSPVAQLQLFPHFRSHERSDSIHKPLSLMSVSQAHRDADTKLAHLGWLMETSWHL